MNLLLISNDFEEAERLSKILRSFDVKSDIISFNQVIKDGEVKQRAYTAVMFIVSAPHDVRQFSITINQYALYIPTLLYWTLTKSVPKDFENKCLYHLTPHPDPIKNVQRIKKLIYTHTVNDLYADRQDSITFGDLLLDRRYRTLKIGDQVVSLRNKEFSLLEFFMMHPQQLLCRNTILESVWDINKTFLTNTIDVHVGKLRKKLGNHQSLIRTIHSIGYIFG